MTPLCAKILAVLLALPVYAEDRGDAQRKHAQLETVAQSIADALPDPTVVWMTDADAQSVKARAALAIATGWEETGYSLRVHEGRCRSHECDHGRARGPWQVQRNGMRQFDWDTMIGIDHTAEQASVAMRRLDFGRAVCGDTRGAIARYFGLPCSARNSAIVVHRWRTYQRILKQM